MFNHVFLGTNDIEKSRGFYNATMKVLGLQGLPLPHATVYAGPQGALIVGKPANGEPHTVSNGHTLGLKGESYEQVNAWHAAGLAAGGADEGAPGVREQTPGRLYGAYLRDPDGNKLCVFTPNADPQ